MGQFLPEAVQLLLGEPALEEGAGVDPWRGVALEEDLVARLAVVLAVEEMVEADLVQAGRGSVGSDVAADAQAGAVGTADHDGRVPPDVGADAALDVLVAREPGLALGRDGVDEVGAAQAGHADLLLTSPLQEPEHDVTGPGPAVGTDHVIEGLHPFPGLVRIDVRQLGGQSVAEDRKSTRLNSSHMSISYAVFCLKKK